MKPDMDRLFRETMRDPLPSTFQELATASSEDMTVADCVLYVRTCGNTSRSVWKDSATASLSEAVRRILGESVERLAELPWAISGDDGYVPTANAVGFLAEESGYSRYHWAIGDLARSGDHIPRCEPLVHDLVNSLHTIIEDQSHDEFEHTLITYTGIFTTTLAFPWPTVASYIEPILKQIATTSDDTWARLEATEALLRCAPSFAVPILTDELNRAAHGGTDANLLHALKIAAEFPQPEIGAVIDKLQSSAREPVPPEVASAYEDASAAIGNLWGWANPDQEQ